MDSKQLESIQVKLQEDNELRGARGGLGRVIENKLPAGPFGAGFKNFGKASKSKRPVDTDLPNNPLYKRFCRGPTLGVKTEDGADPDAEAWRAVGLEVLQENDGEMPWAEFQSSVVERFREKQKTSKTAKAKMDEDLMPLQALAHVPESFTSKTDGMIRLIGKGSLGV